MNKREGFSIVECLVYCALFCLLCILIFNFAITSQVSLRRLDASTMKTLDLYGALDSFALEAMAAPSRAEHWNKITEHELIWQTNENDIGWSWEKGSLYRTTGTHTKGIWHGVTKNLVSAGLSQVQFIVKRNKKKNPISIVCTFDTVRRTIALQNRE